MGHIQLDKLSYRKGVKKWLRSRYGDEAENIWKKWFAAAKESGIPALIRFAELKEKRIDGLIAHATYPISTGRLEGFNNKIKVAKRLAYGYRDKAL